MVKNLNNNFLCNMKLYLLKIEIILYRYLYFCATLNLIDKDGKSIYYLFINKFEYFLK